MLQKNFWMLDTAQTLKKKIVYIKKLHQTTFRNWHQIWQQKKNYLVPWILASFSHFFALGPKAAAKLVAGLREN